MRLPPLLLLTPVLLLSCQSSIRDVITTGHPLGHVTPSNDHSVDITFASSRVQGEALGTTVFKIFNFGPRHYSKGLAVDVPGSSGNLLDVFAAPVRMVTSLLPLGGEDKIASAAVRDACDKAKCDLLGFPLYYVDETDFIIFSYKKVRVVGFPGTVNSMANRPHKEERGDHAVISVEAREG